MVNLTAFSSQGILASLPPGVQSTLSLQVNQSITLASSGVSLTEVAISFRISLALPQGASVSIVLLSSSLGPGHHRRRALLQAGVPATVVIGNLGSNASEAKAVIGALSGSSLTVSGVTAFLGLPSPYVVVALSGNTTVAQLQAVVTKAFPSATVTGTSPGSNTSSTAPPPAPPPAGGGGASPGAGKDLSPGYIVLIVCGGLAAAAAVAGTGLYFWRRTLTQRPSGLAAQRAHLVQPPLLRGGVQRSDASNNGWGRRPAGRRPPGLRRREEGQHQAEVNFLSL